MARIIWTEPALIDLNDIAEYIALDKPSAARALVQKVFLKTERLEKFPESGRKPPELKNPDIKKLSFLLAVFFIVLNKIKSIFFILCEVKVA